MGEWGCHPLNDGPKLTMGQPNAKNRWRIQAKKPSISGVFGQNLESNLGSNTAIKCKKTLFWMFLVVMVEFQVNNQQQGLIIFFKKVLVWFMRKNHHLRYILIQFKVKMETKILPWKFRETVLSSFSNKCVGDVFNPCWTRQCSHSCNMQFLLSRLKTVVLNNSL